MLNTKAYNTMIVTYKLQKRNAKRIIFTSDNTVQVFRSGTTTNKKIADAKDNIVQSYIFSKEQFDYIVDCVATAQKPVFKEFFSLDAKNCFDCPFSMNTGGGGCYTHKVMQYSGFVSMLKSIAKDYATFESIPTYKGNEVLLQVDLAKMAMGRYIRFGTYGEPSLHPIKLMNAITEQSRNWTGYTHQWFKKPEFAQWLMASVQSELQATTASKKFGYRSFIATKDNSDVNAIHCPASKESGYKSDCSKCGLCSGILGKGRKNVVILEH